MSPVRLAAAFAVLFVWAVAFHAAENATSRPTVVVNADRRLPAVLRSALDVRWSDDHSVVVNGAIGGAYSLDVDAPPPVEARTIPLATDAGPFAYPIRLALSKEWLAAASTHGELAWRRRSDNVMKTKPFGVVSDIDVFQDRILILGGQRDEKKKWSPDGAIAWTATLGRNLSDMKPVLFANDGPATKLMGYCDFLDMGAVRYLADGSFIVVPGVQPGILQYDKAGKLVKTWPSTAFEDHCTMTLESATFLRTHPAERVAWTNRKRIVDDVVALPSGPAVVVRFVDGSTTSWELVPVAGGAAIPIPLKGSAQAHLKIDVRGNRLALLVTELGFVGAPQLAPPRLALATIRP